MNLLRESGSDGDGFREQLGIRAIHRRCCQFGVVADMSSLYTHIGGRSSIEDFGVAAKDMKVEIVFG
jgi:hypothetical protein